MSVDLKTLNVSVQNKVFQFEGTAFEFLIEMRERAIGELKLLLERELSIENVKESEVPYVLNEDIYDDVVDHEAEEAILSDDVAVIEELVDEQSVQDEIPAHQRYDTDISSKINKFTAFITYTDSIVKKNGEHNFVSQSPVNEIIEQFKSISSVSEMYGEFTIFTVSKTV